VLVLFYFNNLIFTEFKYQGNTSYKNVLLQSSSVQSVYYEKRKSWITSKLGSILFKNEEFPELREDFANITYVILIWKRHDPLEECSVKNCIFSGDDSLLNTADAVVVHLHTALIPHTDNRSPFQRWIFLDDESPVNSFSQAQKKPTLSDADIPVPYGRTIAFQTPYPSTQPISELVPNWEIKRRDVLANILISNCGIPYRTTVIEELKTLLGLHVYGGCALENTKCKEYITEKLYHHAYSRGAIPIIQGPSIEDCERLLPPNSYLHLDNYATLEDLAKDVKDISESNERLTSFHMWRYNFNAKNEHAYFGTKSYHLCRLCEAMNYNDKTTH
ncbi:putative alpha1,3-fucosyltransferase B-like proteinue, partial [Operophtera brumata]